MRSIVLIQILLLFSINSLRGQVSTLDSSKHNESIAVDASTFEFSDIEGEIFDFSRAEKKPVYPGCEYYTTEEERFNCFNIKIRQFVGSKFEFPEMAKQMGIQGKIWVSFIIEKDGKVSNITIERSVDKLLDDEALRIVSQLPAMLPAKVNGRPVRMRYSFPINAKLQ